MLALWVGAAAASTPLQTAIFDPETLATPDAPLAFQRIHDAGATAVRLSLSWRNIAPATLRVGFKATDPADPAYRWGAIDRQVRLAVANGLEPIVSIADTPAWAEGQSVPVASWLRPPSTVEPSPAAFAQFAQAAARRYSGSFHGLPRVRYWQAWNEPNFFKFLSPQFLAKQPFSPAWYRSMVNAFAAAVHGVNRTNVVIAGGLSPYGNGQTFMSPFQFMRELFCMSGGPSPRPTCRLAVHFDVWATHPYTAGGPTHKALNAGDISLGDLPAVRRFLNAAVAAHHVVPNGALRLWVTEFSWASNPPVPTAVPSELLAHWTSEALYRMWQSGVSLVTWFELRDEPPSGLFRSGLYYRGSSLADDRPKLALGAFRFPLVAYKQTDGILVWGRTPGGVRGTVTVQQASGSSWLSLGTLRSDANGIFSARFPNRTGGSVRAALGRSASVPFSLKVPPDFKLSSAFG
ncbi:MAG: hypothetical protein ACXVRA_09605 [Gaiellaceae bacterium]